MKRAVVSLFVLISTSVAAAAPLNRVPGAVKDRYIVLLDRDTPAADNAATLARSANAKLVHTYTTVLNGFSIYGPEAAALALASRRGVAAVWEVPTVTATEWQYNPPSGLDRIDQRDLPLDGAYWSTTYTSAPVTTIYIADTGVDPRPAFGNRLVANVNFATNLGVLDPNDYTDYGLPLNDQWHGTAVAVIAAGTTYGVAQFANLVNVRVLNGFKRGSYDDVVAGVQWITQQRNLNPAQRHVANASFGDATIYPPAETAFRESVAAGVAWVFGAGNGEGTDACNHSPARLGRELSRAITVGAVDPRTDTVLLASAQGPCVEIFAPSNVEWGTTAETGGELFGGTSAAAPHVAGVFAIRLAGSTGSIAEVEGLIKGVATPDRIRNLWPTSPNLLLYSMMPKRRAT